MTDKYNNGRIYKVFSQCSPLSTFLGSSYSCNKSYRIHAINHIVIVFLVVLASFNVCCFVLFCVVWRYFICFERFNLCLNSKRRVCKLLIFAQLSELFTKRTIINTAPPIFCVNALRNIFVKRAVANPLLVSHICASLDCNEYIPHDVANQYQL